MRRVLLFFGLATLLTANKPLIVNVDNPYFRKIVTTIPKFTVHKGTPETDIIANFGQRRLGFLLDYSRLFKVVPPSTYEKNKMLAKDFQKLGVEVLIKGEIRHSGRKKTSLLLKAIDLRRKKIVTQRQYNNVSRKNIDRVLRLYGNQILDVYTKKSGIFFSKIAFVGKRRKQDHKQIFIMDFDGSNLEQITSSKAHHLSPSWSPDNRYIVYTSFVDDNPDLFIYDRLLKHHRKISGRAGVNSGGQFAHKGNLVAFTGSMRGDTDIFLTDTHGSKRQHLIRGLGLDVDPTFSPNGKWLAFVSGRYGNPHIFRATLNWNANRLQVVDDKRLTYAGWYNANPSWSPDSKKIAFAGYDRDIDRFDIFLMNADGSNLERMTLDRGDNESPSWSPNGMMLAFFSTRVLNSNRKGAAQIYIMSRDGSEQKKLATGLYEARTPRWSRDGGIQNN